MPSAIGFGDQTSHGGNDSIDGIPVAYEGHKTTCGATLIASVSNCGKS